MKIGNTEYVIGEIKEFDYKGNTRKSIKCRLPKGKNLIYITQYENGSFSAPTKTHFNADF